MYSKLGPLFDTQKEARQYKAEEDAAELVLYMVTSEPMKARDIAVDLDWWLPSGNPDERRVRAAAEASHGVIISAPGRPYVHKAQLSMDDYLAKYRGSYKRQIERMTARLVAMDNAMHGRRAPAHA